MQIAEFFATLGFEADQKALDDFDGGLQNLNKTLGRLQLVAAAVAMDVFVRSTVDATVAVQNLVNQTGILFNDIQRWQTAGVLADLSMDMQGVAGAIGAFQQNLTAIQFGQGNVSPFQWLGIDVMGRDAPAVFDDMREAIKGLDDATASYIITQAGLPPNFINILRLTRAEFEEMAGARTFLSEDQRKTVLDLGFAFTRLKLQLTSLKDIIVASVGPAFIRVADAIGFVAQKITDFLNQGEDAPRWFKSLAAVAVGLVIALKPLIVTVTTVTLLFEDLVTFLRGGDSIIGRWIENVTKLGKTIYEYLQKPIENALKKLNDFKSALGFGDNEASIGNEFKVTGDLLNALRPAMPGQVQATANQNNTFNINSTADGNSLANNIANKTNRELSNTLSELNLGAAN